MARSRRSALQAAEKLVSRGRLEAAVKQYRKALAESPEDTGTLNRLGDLHARLNRVDEAVEMFTSAADHFTKEGFFVKAIAIYKKIIRLDPTLIEVYETLADLYHRQGLVNEARAQYQVVADYYKQVNDKRALVAVFEKMVELEPDNPSHRLKLAEFYCASEQIPQAMEQYQKIAHFMLEHGKVEEAFKVYLGAFELKVDDLGFLTDIIVQLRDLGHDEVAQRLLNEAVEKNPDAARVAELVDLPLLDVADRRGSQLPQEPLAGVDEPARIGITEARYEATGEDESAVLELDLTPGAEAIDVSELGLESAVLPEGIGAGEPAADLDAGEEEIAAVADASAEAAEEIEVVDLADLVEIESEMPAEEPPPVAPPHEETGEFEITLDELEAEVAAEDEARPEVVVEPSSEAAELIEPEATADSRADELVTEAQVLSNYGLENKAVELLDDALQLVPQHAEAAELLLHLHHQAGRSREVVDLAQGLVDGGAFSSRLTELLEDWDYRLEDGRVHAPEELEERAEAVPVEPEAVPAAEARLNWLDEEAPVSEGAASEAFFGEEDQFFDLAAELEEELMAEETAGDGRLMPQLEEQSIEEIVEGFKQGVAETLSTEDFDTHYNLGIAYREMGLVDEAIGEFQLAAKSEQYLVDCCSLLGASFLEKGFQDLAVKWYERGLKAPNVSDEEKLGLLYELGNLYLSTGDRATAKDTFAEIYGANSNYRDVVAKLEELRQS
ncbi:MAG: tetratricopeptide repeat protein [bacterium]|nr:tetratricopeptide repeat protein [bacterium]